VSYADLLAEAIGHLEAAGIPYMITGSVASSFHGEPRATRDLDIVIDPAPSALERLIDDLRTGGFYVDRDAAADALRERTQFNAIGAEAIKVDFMVRRDRPFSIAEFDRRERVELLGSTGFIATVEDVILAKLEWAAETDSERQLRDVAGMLAVAGDTLDEAYLTTWAQTLGVQTGLQRVLDEI
jgi:acetolactate synthase regulatory subunit